MSYILDQAKEDALVAWARSGLGTGFHVEWDKQDAPATGLGARRRQIGLPYATLAYFTGPIRVGDQADVNYKELDTYTVVHRKQVVINVTVHAKEQHMKLIQNLINSVDLPSKYTILQTAGLAFWGNEDPQDLSTLLDTKHELIASCDFSFSYATETDDVVGEVQDVTIQGDLDGFALSIGIDT